MALSKQHYVAIARHIDAQRVKAVVEYNAKEMTMASYSVLNNALFAIASGMAADFYNDNPRFDRERFLAACGF